MSPLLAPPTLAKVCDALARGPHLRLAVLFGSQATGEARGGSDADIGIVPVDPDLPLADELALASALSEITGVEIDLVRLDDPPPLLGREVARDGVCLFEADPGAFAAWRAEAMSRWIDFDEIIAPHRALLLARLARARP